MQFITIEKMDNSLPSWPSSIRFYSSRFTKIKKGRKQEIRRIGDSFTLLESLEWDGYQISAVNFIFFL